MKSLGAFLILGSFAFAAPGVTPIARDGAADVELQSPKSFLLCYCDVYDQNCKCSCNCHYG
ncbi:hypothetical protein AC578_3264 [Pseudocercospora eumusae]|uniref:Uncharacterized protein n=1 Tax=Pseudocercospora eumusae TaxID=321146 RepID=A0A139GZF5_9PEZI|nr:hypothetical protein AC578_3264 [Pseudocercospora eumusae]